MHPDPALLHMISAALAIVLLVGAWQKLRDIDSFRAAVERYELLPMSLHQPVAWALPVLEAGAGLALVIDRTREFGAGLGLAVLFVVTGAVAINLLRGRSDLGCGCGGIEDEQTLSWTLVLRNGALAGLFGLTFAEPAARSFTWLDYLSVGAGACCLYGLYVLANQLIANQPRLSRLRSAR